MNAADVPGHTAAVTEERWIEEVRRNADAKWKKAAADVVRELAQVRSKFTTDAVWYLMERDHSDVETHEPRAMGAIMRDAVRRGWIRATPGYAPSQRPECHSRPVRVWESLLYPGRS